MIQTHIRAVLEAVFSLWEAHVGPCREGWYPMGRTPCWRSSREWHHPNIFHKFKSAALGKSENQTFLNTVQASRRDWSKISMAVTTSLV